MADRKRSKVFRLTASMRRELRTDIDHEALEKLVGLLPLESRDLVVRAFSAKPSIDSPASTIDETARRTRVSIGYDITFRDPQLQQLLNRVIEPTKQSNLVATQRHREFNTHDRRILAEPIGFAIARNIGKRNAAALVVRRIRGQPRDVIVLRETGLDARWVDHAVDRLIAERREHGVRPKREYTIAITAEQLTRRLPSSWERQLLEIVERLRRASSRALGDFGMVRFMEVHLASLGEVG